MLTMRTLTADDFDVLHAAFGEAFSDYVVPFKPTREQLREMFTRRGWVPELSVGAFDGERMVGFTANCFDGATAYDSGTGVVPSHRRGGVSRRMFEFLRPILRGAGASSYLLEVIETNAAAEALYRSLGFQETRRFDCWTYEGTGGRRMESGGHVNEEWWDVEPAWQNSTASIRRAHDPHVVLGDERGYAVVFPSNGDVPQLAVAREHRRSGVGSELLHAARTEAGRPLRFLNIDDRDDGISAFLESCGARRFIRQIEMRLPLP
jgi:ribosomal protein S18 acetylase RimI-like enzyme